MLSHYSDNPIDLGKLMSIAPSAWSAPRNEFKFKIQSSGAPAASGTAEPSHTTYTLKNPQEKLSEALVKDLNSGRVTPDTNNIVEALLSPGKKNLPNVQVKTFAVDGIQASDIIFMQRVPARTDSINIVLFIPQNDGTSFQAFNTMEEMNNWLKTVASDTTQLASFSQHFAEGGTGAKNHVIDTMTRFKNNDINAIVGPYANEGEDVFNRLDKQNSEPPAKVNGLTSLKKERVSPEGRVFYSGVKPDGEKVLYTYDAYGNFIGEDKKENFYFIKGGLNTYKPLVPMTAGEFAAKVESEAANNVGANDIRGLYEELLTHLEHPFNGIGDALQVFGVDKNTADSIERYMDNPFSALLLDLNKNNQIGKVFGLEKVEMDSILSGVGNVAQGFVPFYGQARMLGALLAKAIRNEPLSDQEKRDMADALALKPDSPARKNIPASEMLGKPKNSVRTKIPAATEKLPEENSHSPVNGKQPVSEMSVQNGQLIKLGGTMENLKEAGDGLFTFADLNKKDTKVRLNILAHGEEPNTWTLSTDTKTPTRILYNGKPHTPQELLDTLKAKGVDPSEYDNVRLLMCYSGNGKENSFAAEFSKLIGKPVKGYEGTLSAYVTPELINELKLKSTQYISRTLGGEEQLLPVERKAVDGLANFYVENKFASQAFKVAKKNPHYNPVKAWTFTYRPVTFSPAG